MLAVVAVVVVAMMMMMIQIEMISEMIASLVDAVAIVAVPRNHRNWSF